jgi:hypothetical protein
MSSLTRLRAQGVQQMSLFASIDSNWTNCFRVRHWPTPGPPRVWSSWADRQFVGQLNTTVPRHQFWPNQ